MHLEIQKKLQAVQIERNHNSYVRWSLLLKQRKPVHKGLLTISHPIYKKDLTVRWCCNEVCPQWVIFHHLISYIGAMSWCRKRSNVSSLGFEGPVVPSPSVYMPEVSALSRLMGSMKLLPSEKEIRPAFALFVFCLVFPVKRATPLFEPRAKKH